MKEFYDQERANKFIDSVREKAKELEMPVEESCSLLLLIAEKLWVTNRTPPFLEFMKNCDQYLRERDFD